MRDEAMVGGRRSGDSLGLQFVFCSHESYMNVLPILGRRRIREGISLLAMDVQAIEMFRNVSERLISPRRRPSFHPLLGF